MYLQRFTTWRFSKYSAFCVTDGEFLPRTKKHIQAANPRAISDSVFGRDVCTVINFIVDDQHHAVDLKLQYGQFGLSFLIIITIYTLGSYKILMNKLLLECINDL